MICWGQEELWGTLSEPSLKAVGVGGSRQVGSGAVVFRPPRGHVGWRSRPALQPPGKDPAAVHRGHIQPLGASELGAGVTGGSPSSQTPGFLRVLVERAGSYVGSSRGRPCLGGSVCIGRPHPGENEGGESRLWKGAPSWAQGAPLPGTQLLSSRACLAGRVPLSSLELDPAAPPPPLQSRLLLFSKTAGQSTSRPGTRKEERTASALGEGGGARWAPSRGASAGTMASGSAVRQGCSEGLAELNGRVHHTRMCACTLTRAQSHTHAYQCAETHICAMPSTCMLTRTCSEQTYPHTCSEHTHAHSMHACMHAHAYCNCCPVHVPAAGSEAPASRELTGQDAPRNRSGDAFPSAGARSREGG